MAAKDLDKSSAKRVTIIIKSWLPVLLCMGFIFYTSSIPGRKIPSLFPFQDIVYHFSIYSILSFFFARALKNTYLNISRTKIIFFTVIFGIVYGLSDEFHQSSVPYRTVSGLDVFTDTLGSFAGSLIQPFLQI